MRGLGALVLAVLVPWSAQAQDADPRAPFITTPSEVVERMLRLARTGPSDTVIDLGSGDGRIVIEAARTFGARAVGIELDPKLVRDSRASAAAAGVGERVHFIQGDVLLTDISQASVVTVYLLPSLIGRLQPRFLHELKPGTRVVSHAFYMTSWRPDQVEKMRLSRRHEGQGDESTLYLWIVPADVRGTWTGGDWRLRIHQNFQEIEVEAWLKERRIPVGAARLSGAEITWEADGRRFAGRVDGARITGDGLALQRSAR